jgi:hypothetical protein
MSNSSAFKTSASLERFNISFAVPLFHECGYNFLLHRAKPPRKAPSRRSSARPCTPPSPSSTTPATPALSATTSKTLSSSKYGIHYFVSVVRSARFKKYFCRTIFDIYTKITRNSSLLVRLSRTSSRGRRYPRTTDPSSSTRPGRTGSPGCPSSTGSSATAR